MCAVIRTNAHSHIVQNFMVLSLVLSWDIPVVYVTNNKGWGTSNTTSLLVLIKRHVSAYSEAIIRFTFLRDYCLCVADAGISWDINCMLACMEMDVRCGIPGGGLSSWALLLFAMGGGGLVAVGRSVHLTCVALENRGNKRLVCWFVTEVVTLCVAHSCIAHGITLYSRCLVCCL